MGERLITKNICNMTIVRSRYASVAFLLDHACFWYSVDTNTVPEMSKNLFTVALCMLIAVVFC